MEVKSVLVQCTTCSKIFHNFDIHYHRELCFNSTNPDDFHLDHNYIFKKVLYCFPKKAIGKNSVVLPKNANRFILLHPQMIRSLHMVKGCYVLVNTSKGQLLFKSWPLMPDLSVEKTDILLPGFSLFKQYTMSKFAVSIFNESCGVIKNVYFIPQSHMNFMNSVAFVEFVKKQIENMYLNEGIVLHFDYLGYSLNLTVGKIISYFPIQKQIANKNQMKVLKSVCSNLVLFDSKINESSEFETSLSKYSIVDSPIRSDKKFLSSTPISSTKCSVSDVETQFKTIQNLELSQNVVAKNVFCRVSSQTRIFIQSDVREHIRNNSTTFEDIGGYNNELKEIKFLIKNISSSSPEKMSRCILIHGPSGCGKSMIIEAIKNINEVCTYNLKHHLLKSDSLENFNKCSKFLKEIEANSPSILIIEDIETLCAKPEILKESYKDTLTKKLSSIISELINRTENILVIATAENEAFIPIKFREENIFKKYIKLSIPSLKDRKDILLKILRTYKHDLNPQQILKICDNAHGYTGGDLRRVCEKAKLSSMLRNQETTKDYKITFTDLEESFISIKPKSMTEFNFVVPNVKWSDIGGMETVKKAVIEMVDWPLKHTKKFLKFKIVPSRGILLYGAPGCCKTMIAKALASESQLNFISVKGSQLFNKYVGESEKSVSQLFKKARSAAPCVIFFDEIDSLAKTRGCGNSNVADRVLTQLLIEIDGIDILQGVCILAATNRPDLIDQSLLRPGRFDHMIYVPLPDLETRTEIFKVKLKKMPVSPDVNISYLAEATENYTGAEIAAICHDAAMIVIGRNISQENNSSIAITMENFLSVLKESMPRTKAETVEFYENYNNKHLSR